LGAAAVAVGGNGVLVGIGVGGTGVGVGGTEVAVGDGPAPQPLITRVRKVAKRNKVSFFIFHLLIFLIFTSAASIRRAYVGRRVADNLAAN
jgi:hypothetical protein